MNLDEPTEPPKAKEPTLTKAPPTDRKFPCAQCGAKLNFDPTVRSLKCPYCGFKQDIPEAKDGKVDELDYHDYLQRMKERVQVKIPEKYTELRCTGCGAVVVFDRKDVTDSCPYCGTHLENLPDSDHEIIAPESLLPFKLTDRDARDKFQAWIDGLWFAPTELKTIANLGKLNGIYVPHWTYDAMTYSSYQGQRGDNYHDTEYYTDASGKRQSRTVTRTRWYSVSGEVQHFFDDVLVCASKGLPDHLVHKVPPWDLETLTPFQSEFLANFKTERYTLDLDEGFECAKGVMEKHIDFLIRQDIGGDHQRISWKQTNYAGITFKHLLLPIWLAHYRYHDKTFQILVNARTGKVAGDRPWSWFKIVRLVVVILVATALVLFLASKARGGTSSRTASNCGGISLCQLERFTEKDSTTSARSKNTCYSHSDRVISFKIVPRLEFSNVPSQESSRCAATLSTLCFRSPSCSPGPRPLCRRRRRAMRPPISRSACSRTAFAIS